MDLNKPNNSDLLSLFFRGIKKHKPHQPFHLGPKDEKKLALVQKYLKNEYLREDTEVKGEIARLFNMNISQNFFQDGSIVSELNILFENRKLKYDRLAESLQFSTGEETIEFDLIAYGENSLLVVNIYAVVDEEDIDLFIEDISLLREAFPEYEKYEIHGAIGVLEIDMEAIKYANRNGIFIIRKSGNAMVVANRKTFKPKNW